MLEAIDLAAQRGSACLFAALAIRVASGHALVVTGANGTGKTTLLRILAGLSTPSAGRVRWNDRDVAPHDEALRSDVFYGGHQAALKDELSTEENLASLVTLGGEDATSGDIRAALARAALERQSTLPARALSQGQRRRIGLARLMLTRRKLWLLDEPATALDTSGIALLTQLLAEHGATGGYAVVATHQALTLPATQVDTLSLS